MRWSDASFLAVSLAGFSGFDAMPEWYRDAWHVGGEGRGD